MSLDVRWLGRMKRFLSQGLFPKQGHSPPWVTWTAGFCRDDIRGRIVSKSLMTVIPPPPSILWGKFSNIEKKFKDLPCEPLSVDVLYFLRELLRSYLPVPTSFQFWVIHWSGSNRPQTFTGLGISWEWLWNTNRGSVSELAFSASS